MGHLTNQQNGRWKIGQNRIRIRNLNPRLPLLPPGTKGGGQDLVGKEFAKVAVLYEMPLRPFLLSEEFHGLFRSIQVHGCMDAMHLGEEVHRFVRDPLDSL